MCLGDHGLFALHPGRCLFQVASWARARWEGVCISNYLVEVGRLRREAGLAKTISFFCSGDNVNVGAALNGWRILGLLKQAGALRQAVAV